MSSTTSRLDPYTANAENNDVTPQEKINGLLPLYFTKAILTFGHNRTPRNRQRSESRNAYHTIRRRIISFSRHDSRVTYVTTTSPATKQYLSIYSHFWPVQSTYPPPPAYSNTQLTLVFLANNASHKFEEIEHDGNVNVSFFNGDTTAWAS